MVVPTWAFATRINKPLHWWGKMLPARLRMVLSSVWGYGLAATSLAWLTVMAPGIFGWFSGVNDPDAVLIIVFVFLFASVVLACFTFVCAIAGDVEDRKDSSRIAA